jgi:cell division cycle 2-like protein
MKREAELSIQDLYDLV